MKQTLHKFDSSTTQWVSATFGKQSRRIFELITMLGDPLATTIVTMGVIGAGLYSSNIPLVLSGAMIPATVLVGAILKLIFERARPLTEYALNMRLQTFSFPSGHSSGSMITFGLIAVIAFMNLPAPFNTMGAVVLMIVPFCVGLSRVYLGAHFPSDVIAGWLLGLVALLTVLISIRPFV